MLKHQRNLAQQHNQDRSLGKKPSLTAVAILSPSITVPLLPPVKFVAVTTTGITEEPPLSSVTYTCDYRTVVDLIQQCLTVLNGKQFYETTVPLSRISTLRVVPTGPATTLACKPPEFAHVPDPAAVRTMQVTPGVAVSASERVALAAACRLLHVTDTTASTPPLQSNVFTD
jgi:hypothetical protein